MASELIENAFIRIVDRNSTLYNRTLYFRNTPDELSSTKNANINEITILGRSEPIKTYGSSGPRSWTLELRFIAESPPSDDAPAGSSSLEQVVKYTNWCESFVYPIYKRGISYGLPKLLFAYGQVLHVSCICSSVTTQWQGPWELVEPDGFVLNGPSPGIVGPMQATVTLTLDQISATPFGHSDVFNGRHNYWIPA